MINLLSSLALDENNMTRNWNTASFSFLTVTAFHTWLNFTKNRSASVQVVEVQL